MEAILFYGDQDETSRRQVRSVAAQYSHRIGPRKRKKSKLPKHTAGADRKRGQYKKIATATSDVKAAPSGSTQEQQPQTVVLDAHHQSSVAEKTEPEPDGTAIWDSQHQIRSWQLLQREETYYEAWASSSEAGSEAAHSPHTPQLGFIGSPSTSKSPDSPKSSYSRRLPAYTWTEYPRYAVDQACPASPRNGLGNATNTNRPAFELPDPTTCFSKHAMRNNGALVPPRSHPAGFLSGPQQSHAENLPLDHFPFRTPPHISGVPKTEATLSQPSTPPRLQILRCATEEKVAPKLHSSRWRSGNEHAVPKDYSRSEPPG